MSVGPVNEIATNFMGFKLARILDDTTLLLQKSLERLTTGLRIVDAGDDPSGAAHAVKLNSQIRRLNAAETAIANAGDYVQSQSDFLATVSTKLSRLSELAVLAQSASIDASTRSSYQLEFSQIQVFISDIGRKTFNNVALFQNQTSSVIDEDGGQFVLSAITYSAAFAGGGIGDSFLGTTNLVSTTFAAAAQITISTAIANLGMLQARVSSNDSYLTDSASLLTNLEENLQATLDRVQNTDTTAETEEFNRLSLLTQTGQTMLAQYESLRLGLLDLLNV